ncbi:hypothetical protein F5Y19DRAFT_244977 [Xylariaceae sp. FL1651]|nr:hypothetical protein F5Y19DRAFT_244977 [Xylariaceae sp. FL1651]
MTTPPLPPHLQMLNPPRSEIDAGKPSEFTLFPQLPTELRQKIWRHSLEHSRMLPLTLWSHKWVDMMVAHEGEGSPPFPSQAGPCGVVIGRRRRVLSKLLRVNGEAREATLLFYRVHLPCRMTKTDDKSKLTTAEGVIYLNPEFDFISLKTKGKVEDTELLRFIHYFRSMDPRRVGVLNLALDGNSLSAISRAKIEEQVPVVRQSVTRTLKNLRQVFFVYIPALGRRIPSWDAGLNPHKIHMNRSYPLAATSTSFQRMPRDPRNIGLDLTVVNMDWTCSFLSEWREALYKWGVTNTTAETRLLVSCCPNYGDDVHDYESAQYRLRKEDEEYIGDGYPNWYASPYAWGDDVAAELSNEKLEEAVAVKPAFGFWLFPPNAYELAKNHHRHNEFSVLDLTGYWPELCLWNLD